MSPMKRLIFCAGCAVWLSACTNLIPPAPTPSRPPVRPTIPLPSPRHDSKIDILRREASQLAAQVGRGTLSRTAAADQLNIVRLRVVGANLVDDNTFAMYRYLAVERDADRLTQDESQAKMEKRLHDWRKRWPKLRNPPADPAFTNFLLGVYGLPRLGY